MVHVFFNEVKNCSWHPGKILETWNICLYSVSQEVALASFSCLLIIQGMTQGFCGFFLLLGGVGACGEGAGCMAGAGPGFR